MTPPPPLPSCDLVGTPGKRGQGTGSSAYLALKDRTEDKAEGGGR